MPKTYGAMPEFIDLWRKSVAIQVAALELFDESVNENIAAKAMDKCLIELTQSVKRLRKAMP